MGKLYNENYRHAHKQHRERVSRSAPSPTCPNLFNQIGLECRMSYFPPHISEPLNQVLPPAPLPPQLPVAPLQPVH